MIMNHLQAWRDNALVALSSLLYSEGRNSEFQARILCSLRDQKIPSTDVAPPP